MKGAEAGVGTIYVAASSADARYTRICVASIRHFYPDVAISLLAGGRLQRGLLKELQKHWNVGIAPTAAGDYGWGFVKLEPLFGSPGERFLVLDSDTVLTGPVLDLWRDTSAPFLVDEEDQSDADARRLYYDWDKVRAIDPGACRPSFVFNTGQWFGTSGVLHRRDFDPWIDWTMPRRLRHPDGFMPGDQGVLNYVLNQYAAEGRFRVERRPIMRWPGHGMEGLSSTAVSRGSAPPRVVHWAGLKTRRQRDMAGADLLRLFEGLYYARMTHSRVRRVTAVAQHAALEWSRDIQTKARLAVRRMIPPA